MKKISLITLLILSCNLFAQVNKSISGHIFIKKEMSLETALQYHVGVPKVLLENKDFINKIYEKNPSLIKGKKIKKGTKIFIEIPFKTELSPIKKEIKEVTDSKSQLIFAYRYTIASYKDEIGSISAEGNQYYPLSIESEFAYQLNRNYKLITRASFSKAEELKTSLSSHGISLSSEYEVNTKLSFNKFDIPLVPYIQLEYERLSTLNTDQIVQGEAVRHRDHGLVFASIGLSRSFVLLNQRLNFETGISQSVFSSSKDRGKDLSGQKFNLRITKPVLDRVSIHFLFNYYFLNGPSDISIARYGLGASYRIF
ncbi:hypothetical protein BMS_1967 [Halobacteriovorax marinus SJ]|uniref:LysM domain-containing protein n=1 Tax=Halobacteriovorax marinus (strain ATCC BAA-682 / DSM 15412 / SJ) TaxID=862908 RepID=E1X2L5_HALMS|nr:hypothetical protein [Halobacteriovorax marinus]CBW26782.1 hypothetical protein BMS_1967 [Halobacteriovorax marinus SJ]